MNGFKFKIAAATFVLLMQTFVFATSPDNDLNKSKMYRSQLGCMSCHQGSGMQPGQVAEQNLVSPRHKAKRKPSRPIHI